MKRSINTYPNTSFRFRFIFSSVQILIVKCVAERLRRNTHALPTRCVECATSVYVEGQSIHLIDMFAYTFFPFCLVDDDATQFYFLTTTCRLVVTSFRLELRNRLSRSNAHTYTTTSATSLVHWWYTSQCITTVSTCSLNHRGSVCLFVDTSLPSLETLMAHPKRNLLRMFASE